MNIMLNFIRHFAVYMLVLLLPLQAAAAGRFAECAEMKMSLPNTHVSSVNPHCNHSAAMTAHVADHDNASKSKHVSSCWLGSICVVSVGFAALPASHNFIPVDQANSISPFIHSPYVSFIPEGPQRPPAILRS